MKIKTIINSEQGCVTHVTHDNDPYVMELHGHAFYSGSADPSLSAAAAAQSATASFGYSQAAAASELAAMNFAPQAVSCSISSAADLSRLGVTLKAFDKNFNKALPANARLIGWTIGEGTQVGFNDTTTSGTFTVALGKTAGTFSPTVMAATNVAHGTTVSFPTMGASAGPHGFSMSPLGGTTLQMEISSSVALHTATSGSITAKVFYVVSSL